MSPLPLPRPRPAPGPRSRPALSLFFGLLLAGCAPDERVGRLAAPLESRWFSKAEVIGSRGVAPGQFNKPRSVVCDREDNLFVVDMTGRVQKFSPDGRFLLQWQMPQTDLGRPKGLGLSREGHILVVEPHYQRVNHFTPAGQRVAQWGVKGTNAGQMILPRAIVQDSRGGFVISEYTSVERIQVFPPSVTNGIPQADGTLPLRSAWGRPGLGDGEFNRPEGLGLGPDDSVYVADSCNHRIQVFGPDGRFLRRFGKAGSEPGALGYPYDVRVDSAGTVFICEYGNSRITLTGPDGKLLEIVGGPGSAPGEFANPWGLAFNSRGDLYVADSMNHRVQKLVRRR